MPEPLTSRPALTQHLVAVHTALREAGIDHAVGGAVALAAHTRIPRATGNIDLNVQFAAPADQVESWDLLAGALLAGASEPGRGPRHTRALGAELAAHRQARTDTSVPVAAFLPRHPVYHRLVVQRAGVWAIAGCEIKVLRASDLMVFKALQGRPQDWLDVETLLHDRAGDPDEVRWWLEHLAGAGHPALIQFTAL